MQLKTVSLNHQSMTGNSSRTRENPNTNSNTQVELDASESAADQVDGDAISNHICKTDGDPPPKKKIKRLVPFSIQAPLPAEGYVRLSQILNPVGPIPISESEWWARVKSGKYPKPTKHFGPGISAWNVKQIRALYPEETEPEENKATKVGGE